MIRNYLVVALRALKRNRLYSFINVFGLAVGIATCTLILMWVQDELSYDRFNVNGDRVFRVERKGNWQGRSFHVPITSPMYGPTLKAEYPEVVAQVRLLPMELNVRDHRQFTHQQEIFFADEDLFDIFTVQPEAGELSSALEAPNSVVLSETAAMQYFGATDVLGRQLSMEWDDQLLALNVTGVIRDMPRQSHVRFDVLVSMETLDPLWPKERMTTWLANFVYTYLLLDEPDHVHTLAAKQEAFVRKHLEPVFRPHIGNRDIKDVLWLDFMPLNDIYLKSGASWEIGETGSMVQVISFSIIALLILLTACINFVNLSTARAGKRSMEVGIRKVSGADRKQLFRQFLGESILMALFALLISLALVELFMPLFNHFSGKELTWGAALTRNNVLILLGVTLLAGILAGLYPAAFLSSFRPVRVLKGAASAGSSRLRLILVVLQFAISVALIISTLIIHQQYNYFAGKDLGFQRERMLVLDVEGDEVIQKIPAFREELMQDNRVQSVCISSKVPSSEQIGDSGFIREGDTSREPKIIHHMGADDRYLETYQLELLAGRNFSREMGTDENNAVIMNEKAIRDLGFTNPEEAVNKRVSGLSAEGGEEWRTIVGVVSDYHFRSLHHEIGPLCIIYDPSWVSHVTIRLAPGNPTGQMRFVESKWNEFYPGTEFRASFLDERLNRFYRKEGKVQQLLVAFTVLGIFVACLGLFGLAAFSAEQRVKEVGVRKVMGASTPSIIGLFLKEFGRWVLVANLIGWPVAWYFMDRWLQGFAYRITLSPLPFLAGALIALVIAMGTVSTQALKAASGNPVDALKYE